MFHWFRCVALVASVAGCAPRRIDGASVASPSVIACAGSARVSANSVFARARSGSLEIRSDVLARERCGLRVVDIRGRDELEGELGRIEGVEWVAQSELEERSRTWSHDEPIVLVCRSGRRSARAAEQLEALGFRQVASLTGGMLAWRAHGLATVRGAIGPERAREAEPDATGVDARGAIDAPALQRSLARPDAVRWTTAASIFSAGIESCIDGRSTSPVLGTPGGDVGELVLALTALEQTSGRTVGDDALGRLLSEHHDAFGRVYLHTDEQAFERLRAALARDARVSVEARPVDARAALALVLHPPPTLESVVLDHFVRPEHVGCGHLRAMLEHAEEYRTRAELVRASLRAVLRLAWRRPESLDLQVLRGEHRERAVLQVTVEHAVHAHSRVPMLSPAAMGDGVFVLHPQVEAFVRNENAEFLSEHAALLVGVPVEERALAQRALDLGQLQTARTLRRLAARLPAFSIALDPHRAPEVRPIQLDLSP